MWNYRTATHPRVHSYPAHHEVQACEGQWEAIFLRQRLSFPINLLAYSKQGLGPETHSWGWQRGTGWTWLTCCVEKEQPWGSCAFRENGDLLVFRCIHTNRDFISGNRQVAVLLDVVVVNAAGCHNAIGGQYFTGHSIWKSYHKWDVMPVKLIWSAGQITCKLQLLVVCYWLQITRGK